MRLLSLTVRNYRVHRDLTVNFDASRTLIGGANESGKSTLVEAAHRALFLRAKTGGSIRSQMVSTLHSGDPEVILSFEAGGMRWELEKHFAGAKGSTRLTAQAGVVLKDEEAESKVAELLKAETIGGRSAASQLPTLWSHLWVWQGQSNDDPATYTASHKERLSKHLQQHSATAVLQSANDQRVAGHIADLYQQFFTNTGRIRSNTSLDVARAQLEQAEASLAKAREVASRLNQAITDHDQASRDIAEIKLQLPTLVEHRKHAETKLREVEVLRRDENIRVEALRNAKSRREALEANDQTIRDLQKKLDTAKAALQPADVQLAALTTAEQQARNGVTAADQLLKEAIASLRCIRIQHDIEQAAVIALEKAEIHQAISTRHAEAAQLDQELQNVRSKLDKLPTLDAQGLSRLRKLDAASSQAKAALEAMATSIELITADTSVILDGTSLAAGEARILTDSGDLVIGNGTRLRVQPGGGNSLTEARQRVDQCNDALSAELQILALRDLDHAASILEQRQTLEPQLMGIQTRWEALGGTSLAQQISRATSELESAREELRRRMDLASSSSETPSQPADLSSAKERVSKTSHELTSAEAAEISARMRVEQAREKLDHCSAEVARYRDLTATTRQSVRDLETAIHTREEAHGDSRSREQALTNLREAEALANDQLTTMRATLADLKPELLTADCDRFSRAISAQENRLRDAENTCLLARDRLTLDGSTDPEAELRFAEARQLLALDQFQAEQRRAKAIETLHQLFTTSREVIDRALVQPLADRISGYLQCIFGNGTEARVQLSEAGVEQLELIRNGDPSFSFESLSGGAKEQVAAAVRLALAEILAADFEGCLPILFDDAFAYSDPLRIQSLQRMLDLAATRGLQVIIFTCTPADYLGFGAKEIRLINRSSSSQQIQP
ncbi:hypothetical protein JIN85_04965 [Luteolibacter pohnpeiensis]|uniref:Rad50/SbcC-type AAA domain-containing protein n=1 Tax=Luteolibacter pohnpeiensis TaxID=454153 RepID=A0A934VTR4_9BACT|nr:AAA family ATPase [Luteolibacter pohnpeiensis]MBK1881752.1 hypothetical protein [Luteolibacter pohnpeiensis]